MKRTTLAAASVLATGILVGGGVGVASAFDRPGPPVSDHTVSVQFEQHHGPAQTAPVGPNGAAQQAPTTVATITPPTGAGDGICDGTADQVRDRVRDQSCDGTCDGTGVGVGQQVAAQHGEPMHQQGPAHHAEPGPHH